MHLRPYALKCRVLSFDFGPLTTGLSLVFRYWWVWLPIFLFFAAFASWTAYITGKYIRSIKWVLLEIKPPPDVEKSPKIAENIFAGLHGVYIKPVKWKANFFQGKVQPWFSLEIVGNGGDIHFYVRVPEDARNLIEAQFFAQYPDAEIRVADDYVESLPPYLPNDNYDLFGTNFVFVKPDAYPIKTYPFFEEESGKGEFKRTDPLAPFAEIMSSLEPGEHIWIQILIRGTGSGWVKDAKAAVDKIIGKEPKIERSLIGQVVDLIDSFIPGGSSPVPEKRESEFSTMKLTPGQQFVLKLVEAKISKIAFKCNVRYMYIARKEMFHRVHVSALSGTFKQLFSNDLNAFKPGKLLTWDDGLFNWFFPSDKGFFADQRVYKKKFYLFQYFRKRFFDKQVVILNTEELATLFHLPGIGVKAPAFPRVEAKKGQPPAGLPVG